MRRPAPRKVIDPATLEGLLAIDPYEFDTIPGSRPPRRVGARGHARRLHRYWRLL